MMFYLIMEYKYGYFKTDAKLLKLDVINCGIYVIFFMSASSVV